MQVEILEVYFGVKSGTRLAIAVGDFSSHGMAF